MTFTTNSEPTNTCHSYTDCQQQGQKLWALSSSILLLKAPRNRGKCSPRGLGHAIHITLANTPQDVLFVMSLTIVYAVIIHFVVVVILY